MITNTYSCCCLAFLVFQLSLRYSLSVRDGYRWCCSLWSGDCTTLTADYFSTGQTTSYTVASIPYNPPFGTIGANVIPADQDEHGQICYLGFPFCFTVIAMIGYVNQ